MRTLLYPDNETIDRFLAPRTSRAPEVIESVAEIVEEVRRSGDTALRRFTWEFDTVTLDSLAVPARELADVAIADPLREAIEVALSGIERFHSAQVEMGDPIETHPGVLCWRRAVPLDRVGLYIPGGSAPLFSSLLMLAVPARIARVKEIVVCTPPRRDGTVDSTIRFVASVLGIERVFAVGGAQAVGALAFGTESVPAVQKILGPGNRYVEAAKAYVAARGVAIDLPAGPSEIALLIDNSASPEFAAADILAQAEHGADSKVIIVALSEDVLSATLRAIEVQIRDLPRRKVAQAVLEHSGAVVVRSMDEALDVLNRYAPEHLSLMVRDPEEVALGVRHAGSVFLGGFSPVAAGDYGSGTNHVLPTGGAAAVWGGVSVASFLKYVTFQRLSRKGLDGIAPALEALAEAEGLEGHRRSIAVRTESSVAGANPAEIGGGRPSPRTARVDRTTHETAIEVSLNLDGCGRTRIETGLGFFDHLLDQFGRHSGVDLEVRARGDLHVDEHHTVEDTALSLGRALRDALGEKRGINRYGFVVPMDESRAEVSIDLAGRSYLVWEATFARERVGDLPTELFSHFFRSLADEAKWTVHVAVRGENEHHKIEAVFKAFGRAVRQAIARRWGEEIPSTKGSL